jgi:hypothetical protein
METFCYRNFPFHLLWYEDKCIDYMKNLDTFTTPTATATAATTIGASSSLN